MISFLPKDIVPIPLKTACLSTRVSFQSACDSTYTTLIDSAQRGRFTLQGYGLNSGTAINTLQSHQTEFANFHTLIYANLEACREFEYNLEDANLGERLS
jgi:hypothetical protein